MRLVQFYAMILLGIFALLVAGGDGSTVAVARTEGDSCKAYPGTSIWPSNDAWRALNNTVHGRLFRPSLPGGVCHTGQINYDRKACADVSRAWSTYDFHLADPISVMENQWANYTCLPDSNIPCTATGYPSYVLKVTQADDIKAGLNFARDNRIRVNVKSTGHDLVGRSNAPGSLSFWTHHLDSITYNGKNFKLGSGRVIHDSTATLGSGATLGNIYAALDKHNQTIVGGNCLTVSLGGYLTSGGHSLLSPWHGLAADQVVEAEVVTPDGRIQTVSQDQNPDLFWALCGGGGSTFGVITKFTIRTFPSPKLTVASWLAVSKPRAVFLSDLVGYIASQTPYLMDSGVSGYSVVNLTITNPAPYSGLPNVVSGFMGYMALQDNTDPDAFTKILKPINDTINHRWPGEAQFMFSVTEYQSYLDFIKVNYYQDAVGDSKYLVSRLLGKDALKDEKAIGKALISGSRAYGGIDFCLVGGRGVQEATPSGGSNSVNTAWRNSYVHAMTATQGVAFNNTATREAISALDADWEPIRKLTPSSGCYINEASAFEKNWQQAYWGANYDRLLRIKRTIDPYDVFWCKPCIGHDRWHQLEGGQLCKK